MDRRRIEMSYPGENAKVVLPTDEYYANTYKKYTKTCKRCGIIFKTGKPNSVICLSCHKNRVPLFHVGLDGKKRINQ